MDLLELFERVPLFPELHNLLLLSFTLVGSLWHESMPELLQRSAFLLENVIQLCQAVDFIRSEFPKRPSRARVSSGITSAFHAATERLERRTRSKTGEATHCSRAAFSLAKISRRKATVSRSGSCGCDHVSTRARVADCASLHTF